MSAPFESSFIESQRQRLIKLQAQLRESARQVEIGEQSAQRASDDIAPDTGDEGQRLATEELDQNLLVRNAQRIAQIEQALQRIDAGTYGLSEVSGKPISRDRLDAIPEATRAVDE